MNSVQKQATLASCRLFSALDGPSIDQLAHDGREVRIARGHSILRRGDALVSLQLIAHGAVKLYLSSAAGKEFCLTVAGRGMAIDVAGVLGGGKALSHAVAIEPTILLSLPLGALERVMSEQQRREALLGHLTEQLLHLHTVLEDLALQSLDVRVARVLQRLHLSSATNPAARLHRLDQSIISSMANGTRSKVNSHLQALRRLGAIDIQDGLIVVRQLELLAGFSEHTARAASVPKGTSLTTKR